MVFEQCVKTNTVNTCKYNRIAILPRSNTKGAFGPTSMATAPAPPVGRAGPVAYTAMSPATTRA